MAWYRFLRKTDTLVLVEDQVSAIKLAPYVDAVALLGTHLSEAKADEIKAQGYKQIFLSLDRDAVQEAIKLQIKWRTKIPNLYVLGIGQDIKDMPAKEFESYLESLHKFNRHPLEG